MNATFQFGWVNTTTEALNSTLNTFYDGITVSDSLQFIRFYYGHSTDGFFLN
jgi:hypothetical protein